MYVVLKIRIYVKLISRSATDSGAEKLPLGPFLLSIEGETSVSSDWPLTNLRPSIDEEAAPVLRKGKRKITVEDDDEDSETMIVDEGEQQQRGPDRNVDAEGDEDIEMQERPKKKTRTRRLMVASKCHICLVYDGIIYRGLLSGFKAVKTDADRDKDHWSRVFY
jgi:hypothetical protein